jgi:hypothetical protein
MNFVNLGLLLRPWTLTLVFDYFGEVGGMMNCPYGNASSDAAECGSDVGVLEVK